MELFQTDSHFILQQEEHSLWCSRHNGTLESKCGEELANAWNPVCLGRVYGVIGKVKLHPESEWRLLLIKQRSLACQLASTHNIYKIDKIAIVPLSVNETATDLDLEYCKKHHFGIKNKDRVTQANDTNQMSLRGTWNSIKSAAENVKSKKKESKEKEKFEKRILEELLKMFTDSDFFYYSDNYDITNSLQQQNSPSYDSSAPLWKRADEQYFWNKHMLLELIEANTPLADPWLLPVVQGYVQMENCIMDFEEDSRSNSNSDLSSIVDRKLEPLDYNISIISRRSRHRAGTRSRKRGLNSSGACANYVETEQIIEFSPHLVSFVQVRGSIPVFWSQSGFKYRPPPRLDRDEEASHEAFLKHFEEQLHRYSKVAVVSLAELAGKEQVLGDAYLSHVLRLNSPDITYVTFDFHEYCRGMRFENVSILTEGIKDIIKDMRYTWVDNRGIICQQEGVLRVNCVDCLDRTNVVMTAVARIVMETQFRKLGLLPPEESLPRSCRLKYQQIWANNGDAISRQYAGTAALKGDFTRTGERKISGMMKDGVYSANRYYLRFRDAYRQAAIDLTLGQPISEALLVPSVDVDEVDGIDATVEKEENVKMMIEDCKRMLIVEPEYCLAGWGLINADPVTGDSDQQDMDTILLLSQRSVYVAWYDDEAEEVTQYQRIYLEDVDKIEIGMEPGVFKSRYLCLRVVYHFLADEGLFHTFRTPNARLFNNKVVTVQSQEEVKVSLKMIAEAFKSAQEIMSLSLPIEEKPKLDRRKAVPHPEVMDIHQQQNENSLSGIRLPRDVSADLRSSGAPMPEENNEPGPSQPRVTQQARSKSPLSFLTNIPTPNLPPFAKNLNPPKLTFNRSTIKINNAQAKNFFRKIKFTRDSDERVRSDDGNRSDSEVVRRKREDAATPLEFQEEEGENGVVFQSCGILATSPKQLLRSSINLSAENRKRISADISEKSCSPISVSSKQPQSFVLSSHRDQPTIVLNKSPSNAQEKKLHNQGMASGNDELEIESGERSKVFPDEDVTTSTEKSFHSDSRDGITFSVSVSDSKDTAKDAADTDDDDTDDGVDHDSNEHDDDDHTDDLVVTKVDKEDMEGRDEEYCIIENEEVQAILKKSYQLQHPSMKVSLSDSSLSHPGLVDLGEAGGATNDLEATDSSLMSRFKLKVASLSNRPPPTSGKASLEPPVHTKNHIRKSQRAMEVFEQLMKDKLPGHECNTRFIFI